MKWFHEMTKQLAALGLCFPSITLPWSMLQETKDNLSHDPHISKFSHV